MAHKKQQYLTVFALRAPPRHLAAAFARRKRRRVVPGVLEPSEQYLEEAETAVVARKAETAFPRSSPRITGVAGENVAKVVLAWAKLPASIRAAILALVDAANRGEGT